MLDIGRIRHVGGVVQFHHAAVGLEDFIDDARRGGDEIEVEFALQPFLDDLQVQQAQEPAAEAETQSGRRFHLILETGVVEAQFGEAVLEVFELGRIHRVQPAEHDRHTRLETGKRRVAGFAIVGDGVADLAVRHLLDAGDDKAHFARPQRLDIVFLRVKNADLFDLLHCAGRHHADFHAARQYTVDDADENHDAQIGVIPAVDEQRLQRRFAFALR
jgi:hypothetical protein